MKAMIISFVFLFSISIISFVFADGNEKDTYKFENELLPNFFSLLNSSKQFIYNKAGEITFGLGKNKFSKPIDIYYDPKSYECNEIEYKKAGLFFEIVFCLPPDMLCEKGMTICYKPQLILENIKNNFKDRALTKYRKDIACDYDEHGIKILITQKKMVEIRVSFDKHIYFFGLPEALGSNKDNRCFKVVLGDEYSVGAKITNLDGKRLVFTGVPPKKLDDSFWYSNKENNNFWLLTMDFIPMRNSYYKMDKNVDYKSEFRYKSEENCLLVANIRGFGTECNDEDCLLGCVMTETHIRSIDGSGGDTMNMPTSYEYTKSEVVEVQTSMGKETIIHHGDHQTNKISPKISYQFKLLNIEFGFDHTWGHNHDNYQINRNSQTEIVRYQTTSSQKIFIPKNTKCDIKRIDFRCQGWKFLNISSIIYDCRKCRDGAKLRATGKNGTYDCLMHNYPQNSDNDMGG